MPNKCEKNVLGVVLLLLPYYVTLAGMTNFVPETKKRMMYVRAAPGDGEPDVALLPNKWIKDVAHVLIRTCAVLGKLTSGPVRMLRAG